MTDEPDAHPGPVQPGAGATSAIACLVHGVVGAGSGVRRLILDQAAAWTRLDPDVEVGLFVRCEAGTEDAWRDEPHVVAVTSSRFGIVGRFLARELLSIRLALWRPDVIYLRHSTVSPSLFLLALAFPMVIGGDLDDLDELRIRSPLRYWYARLVRDRLLRRARRIVVVTHEIARQPALVRLGRPISVLPNSIDLDDYPELPAPDQPVAAPRLPRGAQPRLGRRRQARLVSRPRSQTGSIDVIGSGPESVAGSAGEPRRPRPARPGRLPADHGQGRRRDRTPGAPPQGALGGLRAQGRRVPRLRDPGDPRQRRDGVPRRRPVPPPAPQHRGQRRRLDRRSFATSSRRWRGRRVPRAAISSIDSAIVERERLDLLTTAVATASPGSRRRR